MAMKAEKIREIAFCDNDYDNGIHAIFQILVDELDRRGQSVAAVYVQTAMDTFVASQQLKSGAASK